MNAPVENSNSEFEKLEIRIFAGDNREFILYDDEGSNLDYKNGHFITSSLQQFYIDNGIIFETFVYLFL